MSTGAALWKRAEVVMGTVVSIHVDPGPVAEMGPVADEAFAILLAADATFSTWRPESPISRLRSGELRASEAPPEIGEVAEVCRLAKALTEGWFDPWAMPGGFDPTGLVKGWAAERALVPLVAGGVRGAMINAGGDLALFGRPSPGRLWRAGVAHPWRRGALACVLELDEGRSVATSGPYERGDHLVEPFGRRGDPAASATVTGPSLALADALATALAVGGPEVLGMISGLAGYEAYLVMPDGSELCTPGIAFAEP